MNGQSKEAQKKILDGSEWKNVSSAQLNEAEWTPYLAVLLFYLHSKGVSAVVPATTCAVGQVVYFWGRAFTGTPMPCAPMGALPRYVATGALLFAVYGTL